MLKTNPKQHAPSPPHIPFAPVAIFALKNLPS
jgi:hypothetical protein